jgi:predicted RNA-binding protein with RPS1 domain
MSSTGLLHQQNNRTFFVKLDNGSIIPFNIFDLPRIRLLNKRNVIMVFTGDPGSGKSYSGLFTAEYLSPDFTAENVVFGFRPFLQKFKECKKGEWIVYEEAGAEFGARDAMTKGNKNFSRILQVYRFKQIPTIFNLPDLNMLDVNGRRMMNYHIKSERIDFRHSEGIGKWYVIKPNDWEDEPKRYKVRVLDVKSRELGVIQEVRFPMASKKLLSEYEKMKKEYFETLYDSILKEPEKKEKKEKEKTESQKSYPAGQFPFTQPQEASVEQNLFLGLLKGK